MVRSNYVSNGVGTILVYNCTDGYFVPPTKIGIEPVPWTNVTCSANKTWIPENYSPYCAGLCLDDPIDATLPLINSTWNGIDREIGSQVVISCPTGYYFTDMNQTLVITCEEDGLWTNYSSGLLICRKPAVGIPPDTPEGAILAQNMSRYWLGDVMNFSCEPPQMSASGETYVTAESTGDGWTVVDPEFSCQNACLGAPPNTTRGVTYDYTGVRIWGTRVNYRCEGAFVPSFSASFSVTCDNGSWSSDVVPICRSIPATGSESFLANISRSEIGLYGN
ncbi:complement receptor type 1-like [Macrobrachium nipponense]|uniref:complement receptor type 1-like n=1 Tax=Macrobrachium nipponense TaxID=159736 RepID=UPI0030C86C9F